MQCVFLETRFEWMYIILAMTRLTSPLLLPPKYRGYDLSETLKSVKASAIL
jgi:hypothetical protein